MKYLLLFSLALVATGSSYARSSPVVLLCYYNPERPDDIQFIKLPCLATERRLRRAGLQVRILENVAYSEVEAEAVAAAGGPAPLVMMIGHGAVQDKAHVTRGFVAGTGFDIKTKNVVDLFNEKTGKPSFLMTQCHGGQSCADSQGSNIFSSCSADELSTSAPENQGLDAGTSALLDLVENFSEFLHYTGGLCEMDKEALKKYLFDKMSFRLSVDSCTVDFARVERNGEMQAVPEAVRKRQEKNCDELVEKQKSIEGTKVVVFTSQCYAVSCDRMGVQKYRDLGCFHHLEEAQEALAQDEDKKGCKLESAPVGRRLDVHTQRPFDRDGRPATYDERRKDLRLPGLSELPMKSNIGVKPTAEDAGASREDKKREILRYVSTPCFDQFRFRHPLCPEGARPPAPLKSPGLEWRNRNPDSH